MARTLDVLQHIQYLYFKDLSTGQFWGVTVQTGFGKSMLEIRKWAAVKTVN